MLLLVFSIITQVIIEILALPLAENGVIYSAINTSGELIMGGGRIFLMAASCFINVPEDEINLLINNIFRGYHQLTLS